MIQEPKIFPYIERLLQGAEVVWKPLGEVCDKIFAGGTPASTKEEYYNGTIPWLRSGEINFNEIDETEKTITELGFSKSSARWVRKNSVLLAMTGATVARSAVNNIELTANQSVCALETNESIINYKYLYYCLANKYEALKNQGQGVLSSLNLTTIKKIEIPLPPLSVQQEIVRILDKFTQLEAELEAELDCRKRQYEYYRNKLLSYEGNEVEWKTLGEMAKKISSGGTPKTTVSEYYNGEIPWLRTQEVGYGEIWDTSIKITEEAVKNSSAKWIPKDCVIIAMYGATVGRVGINKIPLTTNQACANIEVNEEIANYKYVYYCLLNQYEYIKSLGAGSQTNINAQIVKSLKIPLPPLEEQQRITTILDKFHTLVNSINEGLPKEIALRRKQYEYYREKLLTFTNNQ